MKHYPKLVNETIIVTLATYSITNNILELVEHVSLYETRVRGS